MQGMSGKSESKLAFSDSTEKKNVRARSGLSHSEKAAVLKARFYD